MPTRADPRPLPRTIKLDERQPPLELVRATSHPPAVTWTNLEDAVGRTDEGVDLFARAEVERAAWVHTISRALRVPTRQLRVATDLQAPGNTVEVSLATPGISITAHSAQMVSRAVIGKYSSNRRGRAPRPAIARDRPRSPAIARWAAAPGLRTCPLGQESEKRPAHASL